MRPQKPGSRIVQRIAVRADRTPGPLRVRDDEYGYVRGRNRARRMTRAQPHFPVSSRDPLADVARVEVSEKDR